MASLKRKARNASLGPGSEVPDTPVVPLASGRKKKEKKGAESPSSSKHKPGRPRLKPLVEIKTYELSITISVGCSDVDVSLMQKINSFLVEKTIAGKCSLERGGTAYHLHFQMVIRIQAPTMVSVSRILKKYLGWDIQKPAAGIVMCKALSNKGLHTFHGLIGY